MRFPVQWVVKLGGSLSANPALSRWLQALAKQAASRIAIVAGGGTFADEVRRRQPDIGYDDAAAHDMAILAMAQTATALQALEPGLRMANAWTEIGPLVRRGNTVIWRPLDIVQSSVDIAPGWDVTADSLALWLADRLDARGLLLVKSCPLGAFTSWQDWADQGIVDARFPTMAARTGIHLFALHHSALDEASVLLSGPLAVPRLRVAPADSPGRKAKPTS
jgi:aspartokinase-like uncharacterized kinase